MSNKCTGAFICLCLANTLGHLFACVKQMHWGIIDLPVSNKYNWGIDFPVSNKNTGVLTCLSRTITIEAVIFSCLTNKLFKRGSDWRTVNTATPQK